MMTLWLRDRLAGKNLEDRTREYLRDLQQAPTLESQNSASQLLAQLRQEPGPHVRLGKTMWGEPVEVSLIELVKATSVTTGGMGTGKTMFALLAIQAMINRLPALDTMSFGVLDAKGELFERALYLLARRLGELQGEEREALLRRIVIIDFSSRSVISPYNILACFHDDREFFIASRLETLRDLLSGNEKLSLRGAVILKPTLMLLSELGLPPTYLDALLSDDVLRHRVLAHSRNSDVRSYFERHFLREPKSTVAALRARMTELFGSESIRLALSGSTAPDFCDLQNRGQIVLVNCAGPTITRGVRLLLLRWLLSDIRQAIFHRPNEPAVTYLWCADEAQNFFQTKQQLSDLTEVVTMGRSFGTFFSFLCQNISASVPDARLLKQLFTNVKWTMTLRDTPEDAQFLRSALPVTGRLARPDPNPFHEPTIYSCAEERSQLLDAIASLEDGVGYLWLKSRSPYAIKIRTERLDLPKGDMFRNAIEALRQDARFGSRLSRAEHDQRAKERDRHWFGTSRPAEVSAADWERTYREPETLWQA